MTWSQGHGRHTCQKMPFVAPVLLGHRWQQGPSTLVVVTLILVSQDIFQETSLTPKSTLSSLLSVIRILQNSIRLQRAEVHAHTAP